MAKKPTGPDEADPPEMASEPGKTLVTRPLILQTALTIIDSDGADRLSMRCLSEAVGRDAAVLYRHMSNKAAVASALATSDGAAELDRGLDLLLPGLAAALSRVDGVPSPQSAGVKP